MYKEGHLYMSYTTSLCPNNFLQNLRIFMKHDTYFSLTPVKRRKKRNKCVRHVPKFEFCMELEI